MALTLYHVEWCPDCRAVRQKLADLGLAYDSVIVPDIRRLRTQVYKVSGQYYVPVLQEDEVVLTDTGDILTYLDQRYGSGRAEAAEQAPHQPTPRSAPRTHDTDDDYPSCRIN